MPDLLSILDHLGHPRILVVGDLILDRYTWGDAERVSPEAPVLVLRAGDEEVRLGGAASVAFLLRGLDCDVRLAGVVGDDFEGRTLRKLLDDHAVDRHAVLSDSYRPTTVKQRFVGRAAQRHPHQILRVDHETREAIRGDLAERFVAAVMSQLEGCGALLISDYAKGVCTSAIVERLILAAKSQGIPVLVDPARIADYGKYRGAFLLKPNRTEAEWATGWKIRKPEDALAVGQRLCQQLDLTAALVTLDSDGMALVQDDESDELIPTEPREIYDITGAGDMTLAMLGLCLACKVPIPTAARLANLAAGLEVEKLGIATITREDLQDALRNSLPLRRCDPSPASSAINSKLRLQNPASKIVSIDEAASLAEAYRGAGKKIVFTNGCFDLLHVGHLTCLQEAAALGGVLIVAVNSDASVAELKGPDRPIIPDRDRATLLAALSCVDHVLIFDDPVPHVLLRQIRPDVLVKGGTTIEVVGSEVVERYGGHVRLTARKDGISTSRIVERLSSKEAAPTA